MTTIGTVESLWRYPVKASELGIPIDKRRFRANIYLDFASDREGFAEDSLVGRRLRIGSVATVMVLERDPRCKMISLDPDTGEHNPEVFRKVAQAHGNYAGVYCAALVEGLLKKGDSIELLDANDAVSTVTR